MHLGLLLDVSDSMGEDIELHARPPSIKFLNTLTDAVDITVVDFDTEVRAARYSQNEFARLIERIRQQKASGVTALYDAIGVYLDGAGGQDGRKIMLLYTDGGDTRSAIRFRELIDLLKASDVTVYAIGALEHQSASSRNQQRMLLQQIAEVTGGQAFFPTVGQGARRASTRRCVARDPRAVHARLPVDQRRRPTARGGRSRSRSARKDGRDLRVRVAQGLLRARSSRAADAR